VRRDAVVPVKSKLGFAYALSGLLAVLLVVSSVVGLLYGSGGFYESYPAGLAGLVGQDFVTLVLGLPLLLASMWLTARGSTRSLLVWTGTLFYFAYMYYFWVIGGFNALFLIYIAIVSASLFGLLSLLFAIDPEALRARFSAKTPIRPVSGFFLVVSLLFALMWGGMILSSVAAGTQPDQVLREVVIIDLTVMLPLLFVGSLRLWRREAWGYLLGGLLLTKTAATGFTMAFTTTLGAWWARALDPFEAFLFTLFALMMVGALLLLVPYLRSIRRVGNSGSVERDVEGDM
jgi:hypothetical protein